MVAALEILRKTALLVALSMSLCACGQGTEGMSHQFGAERAAALTASYSAFVGAPGRTLNERGDISYGQTGLNYDAKTNILYGRVFVTKIRTIDAPPERLESYRRALTFLNDPAVGGMYEKAGGYFVINEATEGFYLVRPFAVDQTDSAMLIDGMEELADVGSRWTSEWMSDVADIANGHKPPPKKFVPYVR